MPDISMCACVLCPSSPTCYRHKDSGTRPSEYRQAWADFAPEFGADKCEVYRETKPKKEKE